MMILRFYTLLSLYISIAGWMNILHQTFSERSVRISAILKQDAFMPCETRSSLIDLNFLDDKRQFFDRINLILWYRDGVSVPFYTVDARLFNEMVDENDPIDHSMLTNPAVRHISNDSRIELDLSKMTPLLRIKNVTENDEGFYRCRVEHSSHRTFSTLIRLNVIGPPISLQITDSDGNQLEGIIGPYNEFQNITLICKVYGGNPKPSVIWFRQRSFYEEIVDDSYEAFTLENSINGTLSTVVNVLNLRRLDRNDYMANYLCRASTRFYYPPLIASITIDMNLMPVTVRIFMSQFHASSRTRPLIAGVITEFGCRAEGSKPNANIEWFLDDQRIVVPRIGTATTSTTNSSSSSSNICNETHHHLHTYYDYGLSSNNCMGDNNNKVDTYTAIRRFNIVELLNNGHTNTNYSNELLSQRCKFLSIIETHKVNSTLSIIRFIPHYDDNNRILSCHASNPFIANPFNKIVDKISLNIQYGPIVNIGISLPLDHRLSTKNLGYIQTNGKDCNEKKLLTVAENLPLLELNCHIKANPWVDHVLWYQNETIIEQAATPTSLSSIDLSPWTSNQMNSIQTSTLYLVNHNQTLRIENIQRLHSAYYRCKAFNSINDSFSEVVKLNVAYVPKCLFEETQLLLVKRNIPLTVDCQVDSEPSINVTYQWTLFSPSTRTNIKTTASSTIIENDQINNETDTFSMIIVNNSSVLDVLMAINLFISTTITNLNDHQLNNDSNINESFDSYSTLLLQCEAYNSIGKQKTPCSYSLEIHPGPPQKVSNCTFQLDLQEEDSNKEGRLEEIENMNEKKVFVGCIPGNHGGRKQSVHLIGSLSCHTWQKFWNDSLETNSSSFQSLIQSIQLALSETENQDNNDDNNDNNKKQFEEEQTGIIKKEKILWNQIMESDHTNEVVWFQLDNVTINQSYDIIVYAQNSIGISEPLTYFNVVLFDDDNKHVDNQNDSIGDYNNDDESRIKVGRSRANIPIKSKNWAYLRLKGLIVILVFILLITLAGTLIRSFVSTASLNDTLGTHSVASNETPTKRKKQQGKTNQEELISIAQTKRSDTNQSEQILFDDDKNDKHWNHDTNESKMETYYSTENDQTSQPKDIDSTSVTIVENILSHTIVPIKGCFTTLKRFLNRSMRNTSHYRTYDLTPCSHDNFPPLPDSNIRTKNYQEEWEFSFLSNSNDINTVSDSSSTSSSSETGINRNNFQSAQLDLENCSSDIGIRRLAKLFNRFNKTKSSSSSPFSTFVPSTVANNEDKKYNRSKKYVKDSNRYVGNSQQHYYSEDYDCEKNVELLYVFNKDLY